MSDRTTMTAPRLVTVAVTMMITVSGRVTPRRRAAFLNRVLRAPPAQDPAVRRAMSPAREARRVGQADLHCVPSINSHRREPLAADPEERPVRRGARRVRLEERPVRQAGAQVAGIALHTPPAQSLPLRDIVVMAEAAVRLAPVACRTPICRHVRHFAAASPNHQCHQHGLHNRRCRQHPFRRASRRFHSIPMHSRIVPLFPSPPFLSSRRVALRMCLRSRRVSVRAGRRYV